MKGERKIIIGKSLKYGGLSKNGSNMITVFPVKAKFYSFIKESPLLNSGDSFVL